MNHTIPKSGEIRGFRYALELLQGCTAAELNTLQSRLAQLRAELERLEADQRAAQQEAAAQQAVLTPAAGQPIDPARQLQARQWFDQEREQSSQRQTQAAALRQQIKQVLVDCLRHQQKADVLDAHRAEALAEFLINALQGEARQSDQDWLARLCLPDEEDPA
ncbi:hypothetical protein GT347_14965 [Xylophilus rhododendri]|uniref:Uncharacterized protein n=1 Tax=Xylophilus rhododendri TaxID=2697032 RepID=A0A857J7E4_9BURK|nr:hypothetical protein [Xylophilus rhododendri]QHI99163.1 hypothetical protein GT347_14965 [Xylophilus rhododendri]